MGRFIVMDIVFYGSSLNYDQGTGNYQELKKITKWDGRQYTLVSRYALRYSILETANKMGLWALAEGDVLTTETGKQGEGGTIQPKSEILLSGEILKYPEFDLFRYLITSTTPQNFREAPVKVSHAVSMTPFNYDVLFNANIGLANRVRRLYGVMEPNPFTAEEHETYYQYTVTVDVDKIGKVEAYISKKIKEGNKERTMQSIEIKDDIGGVNFRILYGKDKILEFKHLNDERTKISISKIILPFEKDNKNIKLSEKIKDVVEFNKDLGVMVIEYRISDDKVKERIKQLILTILNLKRSIKGRDEDLSPKLMIVGVYKNHPYKTYKDRIFLVDEHYEEEYDEIEEREEDGKKIVKIKHVVSKSKKPVFKVLAGNDLKPEEISEERVTEFIDQLFNNNEDKVRELKIFYDPSIEVKIK